MGRPGVRVIYGLLGLALGLSLILAVLATNIIPLRGGEYITAKEYALSLLDYNLKLAEDLEIPAGNTRVNLYHEKILSEVNRAKTPEELYHLILTDMSRFEEIIREEADNNLTNWLEWVINQDGNLNSLEASTDVIISFLAEQNTTIDGGDFLATDTIDTIKSHSIPGELGIQAVTIAIDVDSKGIVTTRVKEPLIEQDPVQHMQNQYKFLEQEYSKLLASAGYAELTGPGLIISLQDAEDEYLADPDYIIHDVDVQEIVHSLFASGALGISVGDRRLIATSSIRCVGGPILVNYVPVPVKPLVIKAVGNPEVMLEYLEPLLDFYTEVRKLRIEISTESEVRLPGQSLR